MRIQDLYNDIRYTDRPITQPADPESYALQPGEITAPYEAKRSETLAQLHPDVERFRTYTTDRYITREYAEREWSHMWTKVWQIAGRSADIPNVGDWFKYDIGSESFIVVRSAPGQLHGFYNVCKHRGNRIVTDDFGTNARNISCMVHSWRWDLQGRNIRVTDRSTFKPEALCGDLNLTQVHLHEWGGFVFLNMAENPMPFEEFYGEALTMLDSYKMEDMFVIKDVSVEVPANWKATVDIFYEGYHAHSTHPQIMPFVEELFIQHDFYPNGHSRSLFPNMAVSARWPDRNKITELLSMFAAEAGLNLDNFSNNATDVRRAIQKVKRLPNNPFGIDYSAFTDNQLTDDWNPGIFPNVTLNAHPEGVLFMRMRPHPKDPERSFYDIMVLSRKMAEGVRPPSYMGIGPEVDVSGKTRPARLHTNTDEPQVGEVLEQDLFNITNMQKGMRSRGLAGVLRYSQQEARVQHFHAELEHYLEGKKG